MRKPTMWFDINWAAQAQKMATSLKFRIYEEEGLYYPSSENKGADQLRLICIFVFAYADCWFSHEAAHVTQCCCATEYSLFNKIINEIYTISV